MINIEVLKPKWIDLFSKNLNTLSNILSIYFKINANIRLLSEAAEIGAEFPLLR